MTTRQQRFKAIKDENPGPGSYEVMILALNYTDMRDKFLFNFLLCEYSYDDYFSPFTLYPHFLYMTHLFVRQSFVRSCTSFVSKSLSGGGLISFCFCARLPRTRYIYTPRAKTSISKPKCILFYAKACGVV